ncbi:TetR/AcrR family transcriptional regulator [Actibacterium pelagium]|uniref:TetR family transcriptional regulator n=1 Tax=Actibacterium pelagium TaxID=2029103 RepID=A0A917AMZ5_9RHOB|nr:TetR/AcrR family transcriptional regulator [Actibacterium pelagium]GGE62622.1 TetR family transcriptional regulator [Actibacterium pelagium]
MILDATRSLVEKEGYSKVSIRKITNEVGYTSGTLYLVFKDIDELLLELHIETLERLHALLHAIPMTGDPEADLLKLSDGYSEFTKENRNLWNALFEHKIEDGKVLPERYDRAIFKLIDLAIEAIRPLYQGGSDEDIIHDARVLWASLYGILSLDASKKLSRYEDTQSFIASLIKNYVAGIRSNLSDASISL